METKIAEVFGCEGFNVILTHDSRFFLIADKTDYFFATLRSEMLDYFQTDFTISSAGKGANDILEISSDSWWFEYEIYGDIIGHIAIDSLRRHASFTAGQLRELARNRSDWPRAVEYCDFRKKLKTKAKEAA